MKIKLHSPLNVIYHISPFSVVRVCDRIAVSRQDSRRLPSRGGRKDEGRSMGWGRDTNVLPAGEHKMWEGDSASALVQHLEPFPEAYHQDSPVKPLQGHVGKFSEALLLLSFSANSPD